MVVKALEGFLLNCLVPLGLLWVLAEALLG